MRYESKEERDKDVCCQHAYLAYTQRPSLDTYGTVSSILLLNTDLAVVPLSLASPGILALEKFD